MLSRRDALTLPGRHFEVPPLICYLDRGTRRGHPPCSDPPARRRREPGRDHSRAARTDDRQRHCLIARSRGRPPGRCSAGGHPLAAAGAAEGAAIGRGRTDRVAIVGAVDLRDHRRFLVGGARVGVSATMGLLSVVSLPRAFVFRMSMTDPHPFPWIRVLLSSAMGAALYPHPQWNRLGRIWEAFYPPAGLDAERAQLIARLRATMSDFVVALDEPPAGVPGRAVARGGTGIAGQPARAAGRGIRILADGPGSHAKGRPRASCSRRSARPGPTIASLRRSEGRMLAELLHFGPCGAASTPRPIARPGPGARCRTDWPKDDCSNPSRD